MHDVPAGGLRRVRVEHPRQPLAQIRLREAEHAVGPGQPRQHRRLEQALQVDRHRVVPPPQLAQRRQQTDDAGPGVEGHDVADRGDHLQQAHVARIHQPVDARLGKRGAHRRRGGNRMDDVAERAEADDQEARRGAGARAAGRGGAHGRGPETRASRSRVEWSLGSPTIAVRPP